MPASSCMRWKSSELRTSAAIRRTPSSRTWRASLDDLASPVIVLDGLLRRRRGPASRRRARASARARSASSTARASTPLPDARAKVHVGAAGDREVGEAADGEVEDELVVGAGAVQRADHREGGEVDALGLAGPAARSAARTRSTISRRAATSSTRWRRPVGVVDDGERLVVEHRVLERHRKLVLRLEAHGRGELLGVLEVGQVDDAHDDLLVGQADADALVEALVLAVQRRAAPRPGPRRRRPRRRG